MNPVDAWPAAVSGDTPAADVTADAVVSHGCCQVFAPDVHETGVVFILAGLVPCPEQEAAWGSANAIIQCEVNHLSCHIA